MTLQPGYIYILTNPSFPDYVKIGFANDVSEKIKQLNRCECVPFAFRLYATYLVDEPMSDTLVHQLLDKINPNLHSIHTFANEEISSEFYAMTPEEAYDLLSAIAKLSGTSRKLSKGMPTFEEIEKPKRRNAPRPPFRFSMCHIEPGEYIEFWNSKSENCGVQCEVLDDRHVKYDGQKWSLSALATELSEAKWSLQGPMYFRYKGERLSDLRNRLEESEEENTEELPEDLAFVPFPDFDDVLPEENVWSECSDDSSSGGGSTNGQL